MLYPLRCKLALECMGSRTEGIGQAFKSQHAVANNAALVHAMGTAKLLSACLACNDFEGLAARSPRRYARGLTRPYMTALATACWRFEAPSFLITEVR